MPLPGEAILSWDVSACQHRGASDRLMGSGADTITLCYQVRTLDRSRLGQDWGKLDDAKLRGAIRGAIRFQRDVRATLARPHGPNHPVDPSCVASPWMRFPTGGSQLANKGDNMVG